MKPIPTVKEFLKIYLKNNPEGTYDLCMIEFAKLHVIQALKEASEKAEHLWDNNENELFDINKDSILEAYPLTNIK